MIWWYEKRNQKFKDLNSSSKILVYLYDNAIVWSVEKTQRVKTQKL